MFGKIKCLNCNHEFMFHERATISIEDRILGTPFSADACPRCNQWLLSYQSFYEDGAIAMQVSGGSAAFLPAKLE